MVMTSKVLCFSVSAIAMASMVSIANASDDFSLFPKPIVQMQNAKQVAGIYFLPELTDSELGFGGNQLPTSGGSHNSGESANCGAYKFSKSGSAGTNVCSNPKSLYSPCPFDSNKFLSCSCNRTTFPYDSSNCVYVNTSAPNANGALSGSTCYDTKVSAKGCSCTPSNYSYTSDASCYDSNKQLDQNLYCYTSADSTRRYKACKCKPEFNLATAKNRSDGWDCTSCSDGNGTKHKCVATTCPTGSAVNKSCSTNQTPTDTEYKSGGEICQSCQSNSNCSYFWNADGSKTIPTGKCSWRGFGAYSTIYSQSGPYTSTWVQFWQNTTINNDFETSELRLGNVRSSWGSPYTDPRTYTFNGKVTINGKLLVERSNTSFNFKGGICGKYTCHNTDNAGNIIGVFTCPAKSSNCKFTCDQNNYWNDNGLKTIPTSWCHLSGYGTSNETVIQGSQQQFSNVDWTFTDAFIRGGKMIADKIIIGKHGEGMQTNARFDNLVEVNEEIIIINDSTVAFPGGVSGDYSCLRQRNGIKTAVTCPFKCSQNNFFNSDEVYNPSSSQCNINGYGSSNTTNIPSGGLHLEMAQWTFSNATVNGGPLYISGKLVAGMHSGGSTSRITFNVPIYLSGDIVLYEDSSLTFKKGITGAYKCYRVRSSSKTEITCPF